MHRDELAGWLRLGLAEGMGSDAARRLLAAFGLPQQILAQSIDALAQVVSPAQAHALHAVPADRLAARLDTTWSWLQGSDERGAARAIVTLGDARYPGALLATDDPPVLLYLLGAPTFVDRAASFAPPGRCLAMVGSRNPTAQGTANARAFAQSLRAAGLTVVSGLALGVDGAAHEGALDAGVDDGQPATIAIVGTGLDRVYPRRHLALAHRIAQHGLIVSEYPLGTPPLAPNFPKRNRIISGLSQGTLVVEAALASGSLITARMASEQGREVFAIPGSIHAPQSRGCHALIRQGAKLVESAQDVLEELHLPVPVVALAAAAALATPHDGGDDAVLRALGFDPAGLDALVARTGIDTAALQVRLLELELSGEVARLPGGLFQRVGQA